MKEIILTSSVLILALAALRKALRGRIDPRAQYALWLLVAVRLLIPGTLFSAPVSTMGAVEGLQTSILSGETSAAPPAQTPKLPGGGPAAPSAVQTPDGPSLPAVSQPANGPAFTYARAETIQPEQALDCVWKAGIAATGGAMAVSNLIFYLRLRRNRRRLEPSAAPWAGNLPVYEAERLSSPCLFGLFRPAIYLNQAAMDSAHPAHILAHEYAHYCHGDHFWSILRCVCTAVHWYNPLVWWAAALSRQDCELACDAAALRRLGEADRIDYGQTLLGMVSKRNSPAALLRTDTTMSAGKRAMTERIALIIKRPRTRKITLALATALACLLAACSFGDGGGVEVLPEAPSLHWNDSLETVMETLGVSREDFLSTASEDGRNFRTFEFTLENPNYGGAAQYAIFHFSQYSGTGHGLGLDAVTACYPNDMENFDALREELVQQYGQGTGQDSAPYTAQIIADSLTDDHAKREIDAILGGSAAQWEAVQAQPGPHCYTWDAGTGALPKDQADKITKLYKTQDGLSGWLEYAPEFPTMVRVSWEDNSLAHFTFNEVTYDARNYVMLLQGAMPAAEDATLLEFPGVHWNDTPEAVMAALGITEEDILERSEEHADTANTFSLAIGDYPLYGETAQYVIFRFIQYIGTGSEMGLQRVEVCYPDDMENFSALQETLFRQFGPETSSTYLPPSTGIGLQGILGDRYERWTEIQKNRGIKSMQWAAGPYSEAAAALRASEENYQTYWTMATSLAAYVSLNSITRSLALSFEECVETFDGVTVTWNCNALSSPTFNRISFDGREYVQCLQMYSVASGTRNAGLIVDAVQSGEDTIMWLPNMNYLNWDALRQAAVDAGLDDGDGSSFALEVMETISQFIAGPDPKDLTWVSILTATDGLDGELAERYGALVRQLQETFPSLFDRAIQRKVLPEEKQNIILSIIQEDAPS